MLVREKNTLDSICHGRELSLNEKLRYMSLSDFWLASEHEPAFFSRVSYEGR